MCLMAVEHSWVRTERMPAEGSPKAEKRGFLKKLKCIRWSPYSLRAAVGSGRRWIHLNRCQKLSHKVPTAYQYKF